jgi:hypothetical protein
MRCREAKLRLTVMAETGQDLTADKQLSQHLGHCADCARLANAARDLRQTFAAGQIPDEVDQIGWAELQRRVETRVAPTRQHQPKEISFMSTLRKQFKLRPRLSVSLAAAIVVLLAATLIPLKFDRAVGFEVAVAGVDRDLALNQEKLDELLERLGLENVTINIQGCEATCNLLVSDLESQNDANMIRLAFEAIGNENVFVELIEVREDVSRSALEKCAQYIWVGSEGGETVFGEDELHRIVIERLGDDFDGESMIFIGHGEDGGMTMELLAEGADGSDHEFTWTSDGNGNITVDDEVMMKIAICDPKSGLTGIDEDGNTIERKLCFVAEGQGGMSGMMIDPDDIVDGHLTAEKRAELEATGHMVEEIQNDDGSLIIKLSSNDGGNEMMLIIKIDPADEASGADGSESDESVSKEVELPDGYALAQNYPNPFNPETRIDYSLAQSEHVTLEVYNINGQRVRTLIDEMMPAGQHSVMWDATTDGGSQVASGVYLYRLTAGEITDTKKMSFVK